MIPKRLHTSRLLLRRWEPEDAPALRRALDESDAHLRPWIRFMKDEPRTLTETTSWIGDHISQFEAEENYRFAAIDASGELVGEVMLLGRAGPDALEIGYWLHRDACSRGYALEAVRELVRVALEHVSRLEIHCDRANHRSNIIPDRLGFKRNDGGELYVWSLEA